MTFFYFWFIVILVFWELLCVGFCVGLFFLSVVIAIWRSFISIFIVWVFLSSPPDIYIIYHIWYIVK